MRTIQHAITDFEPLQFIPRAERLLAGWDLVFYLAHFPDRHGFHDLFTEFVMNRDLERLEKKWHLLLDDRREWSFKVKAEVESEPAYVVARTAAAAAQGEVERAARAFREGEGSMHAWTKAHEIYDTADTQRRFLAAVSHHKRLLDLLETITSMDSLSL